MSRLERYVLRAAGPIFVAWASWVSSSIQDVKVSVTEIRALYKAEKQVGGNDAAESSKKGKESMKSYHVHYANKYPGGRVFSSESVIEVFTAQGELAVRLEKSGSGQWIDKSKEYGARDEHDLAPIPKNSRFMKLHGDGKISHAEEHSERKPIAQELASIYGGRVPSIKELEKDCDEQGNWKGKKAEAPKQPEPPKDEPKQPKSFEQELSELKAKHGQA